MENNKTFDKRLEVIWADCGLPNMTEAVKIQLLVVLHDIAPELLELANSYSDQELDDDELITQMHQVFDDNFGLTEEHYTRACEVMESEFDFGGWLAKAEGPPSPNQIELMGRENTEE